MNGKNKIGIALYNEFRAPLESFLSFLNSIQIDYVEIGKEWIPTRKELSVFRDLLEIYQLGATLHINDDYNLAEQDKIKWKRNLLGVLGNLSVCYDLGIEYAVLHCGWVTHPKKILEGYNRFGKAYQLISNFAEDLGVKICLENQCSEGVRYYIFQDHKDIIRLAKVCSPNDISFVLDIGHLGRLGTPMEETISHVKDRLLEIHLHDYKKSLKKDHFPLGTGDLDARNVLEIIDGPLITLEVRSVKAIRDSVSYVRKLSKELVLCPQPA